MIGIQKRHPGVRVPSAKLCADKALTKLMPPERVYVPLVQHKGSAAKVNVKRRARVLVGEPLSYSDNPMEVPVHSPVSGTVRTVGEGLLPSGHIGTVVCIENDGEYEAVPTKGRPSPDDYEPEEIVQRVHEAGIVGLGGASFPTSVKLQPKQKIDTLILNGCEGEPILSADHRVILDRTEDMMYGALAMQKALGAERLIIALETHDPDGAAHLRATVGDRAEVVVVPARYPVSAEFVLTEVVLGRKTPPGGFPFQIGVAVQNVQTAMAVGEALRTGCPLTHRVITVAGNGMKKPGNYIVPIGTTIEDVLQAVQCEQPGQVILGGPMMGQSVPDLSIPVVKGTSGVLVLAEDEVQQFDPLPCVQCAACIDVCAHGLTPMKLVQFVKEGDWDKAAEWGLNQCMECGSCAYVCPSNIPLVQWFRSGKTMLQTKGGKV